MSAPELPRVESVPGQLVIETTVRDVLARAHFERFVRSAGLTARWEDLTPAGRYGWGQPVAHLTTAVHDLLERAMGSHRDRLMWAVGSVDRTLAAGPCSATGGQVLRWCGHALGEWQCSREAGHERDVHAAGDGIAIVAACAVIP